MYNSIILWVIIGIVALSVDIITSSFLFVWFTVGAIGAIIAEILNYPFITQLMVFLVISVVLIVICYPIVKKNIKKYVKPTPLREETYVGKEIVVDEEMVKNNALRIDGVYWNIKNQGDALKKGDMVKVTALEGNRLIIKKI
ncbi:NfeD family protein [Clostridium kluyveri]|uniref:Nodulation efficiency protein D n=1 Tax=Clostridium kluyveri TaxID=1534 RepID=A0A1L5F5U0_CLOKL|nr:NfeD family protein [Clostridium kluyveri]APM38374.1 nodulation efficiency protein D [Clostridium kluyveri]UZQ50656.1 NfeD family protein [Clostridium kluyveri]